MGCVLNGLRRGGLRHGYGYGYGRPLRKYHVIGQGKNRGREGGPLRGAEWEAAVRTAARFMRIVSILAGMKNRMLRSGYLQEMCQSWADLPLQAPPGTNRAVYRLWGLLAAGWPGWQPLSRTTTAVVAHRPGRGGGPCGRLVLLGLVALGLRPQQPYFHQGEI